MLAPDIILLHNPTTPVDKRQLGLGAQSHVALAHGLIWPTDPLSLSDSQPSVRAAFSIAWPGKNNSPGTTKQQINCTDCRLVQ